MCSWHWLGAWALLEGGGGGLRALALVFLDDARACSGVAAVAANGSLLEERCNERRRRETIRISALLVAS